MKRQYIAIVVAVVIAGWTWTEHTPLRAQQPIAAGADVLPALLTEVRGLRAAMEQMASDNAHAQLLVGRLHLQEGRIAGMVRRLDTVHDSLSTAKREYEQIRGSRRCWKVTTPPARRPRETGIPCSAASGDKSRARSPTWIA